MSEINYKKINNKLFYSYYELCRSLLIKIQKLTTFFLCFPDLQEPQKSTKPPCSAGFRADKTCFVALGEGVGRNIVRSQGKAFPSL